MEGPAVLSSANRNGHFADRDESACAPRVLVVDDSPSVLFMLRRTLEAMDLAVDTASSLDEALRALDRAPYRAVITDLRLAGDERTLGLELVAAARAAHPRAAVIVLTGFGNPTVMDQVFRLGASFYFEKPVSVERLRLALAGLPPAGSAPPNGAAEERP